MKPKLLKVFLKPQQSFSVRHDAVPYFYKELHFNPDPELVHIQKGSATYKYQCFCSANGDVQNIDLQENEHYYSISLKA